MNNEYTIQAGDSFHNLAMRMGGSCDDFLCVNPNVDPLKLQIGQKIVLPEFKSSVKGQEQYADISVNRGQEFLGDYLDDVEMEVEGVRFRLRRIGEPKTPHEIHYIVPRTEIRKIQPAGEGGPAEIQIMISNLDVVLSPRLLSGEGDKPEQAKPVSQSPVKPASQSAEQAQQSPQQFSPQGAMDLMGSQQFPEQPRRRFTFPRR